METRRGAKEEEQKLCVHTTGNAELASYSCEIEETNFSIVSLSSDSMIVVLVL